MLTVLIDLDGTVCDTSHRHHMLQGDDRDWAAHSMACGDDKPVLALIYLLRIMSKAGVIIVLASGRHDTARQITKDWLNVWGVPYDMLFLRDEGDHTPNGPYKQRIVDDLRAQGHHIVLAIDDYWKAAEALEEHGVPTILVHEAGKELGR